jgi:hypothetical protein
MERLITSFFFLFLCVNLHAQQYLSLDGVITFFSEAPLENISAENKKVSAVYDSQSNEIVFQLQIEDFIFPKPLMQEHFNENYLESDIFPKSLFVGKVIQNKNGKAIVVGELSMHGKTNRIKVEGSLKQEDDKVIISSEFIVKLEDYNIAIPKIVMYKIAEEIEVKVNIELIEVK